MSGDGGAPADPDLHPDLHAEAGPEADPEADPDADVNAAPTPAPAGAEAPDAAQALAALRALGDPDRAAEAARQRKTGGETLGVPMPAIDALARDWRAADPSVEGRVALASGLWATEVFEARVAAARLLVQARIKDDEPVWALIASWVPDCDDWILADQAADAGKRRLAADPDRLDEVESWTISPHPWTRRAALAFTLGWSKGRHPSPEDHARRERILGWAATLAGDRAAVVQKAVVWWLRSLAKHDPDRVRVFVETYGSRLKPGPRAEATRLVG